MERIPANFFFERTCQDKTRTARGTPKNARLAGHSSVKGEAAPTGGPRTRKPGPEIAKFESLLSIFINNFESQSPEEQMKSI